MVNNKTQKILILYENSGAGHQRVTRILETILGEVENYHVVSYAASELFDDPTIKMINKLWSYLLRQNWITLADTLINFFLRIWVIPIVEVMQTGQYLDKLAKISPDIIICTGDGVSKVLGTYAREKSIPFYLVITDTSIFIDLVNPGAMHICYFPETINAIRSFSFESPYFAIQLDRTTSTWDKIKYVLKMYKKYILLTNRNSIYRNIDQKYSARNAADGVAIGPLVEPIYYEPQNKEAVRQKFGIDLQSPCLLVISGSIGGAYLSQVVRTFQEYNTALTILVVCGQDQAAYQKVGSIKDRHSNIKVIPFGFVDYLNELYAATDVVVARPSAGVLLETLMSHIPLITSARATANDMGSVELISRYQLGEVYHELRDIPHLFTHISDHYPQYINNISNFLAQYPTDFGSLKKQIKGIILP